VEAKGGSFRSVSSYEEEKEERALRRLKYYVKLVQCFLTNSLLNNIVKSTQLLISFVAGKPVNKSTAILNPMKSTNKYKQREVDSTKPVKNQLLNIAHRVVFTDNIYQWPLLVVNLGVGRATENNERSRIIIKPSLKRLKTQFRNTCSSFVVSMDSLPQLYDNKQIMLYIQNYSTPAEKYNFNTVAPTLKDIVAADENQKINVDKLDEYISECYRMVEEHSVDISPLLRIREDRVDILKYQLDDKDQGLPIQAFRDVINNLQQQIESVQK